MEVNVISVTGEERAAIGQKVKQPFLFFINIVIFHALWDGYN